MNPCLNPITIIIMAKTTSHHPTFATKRKRILGIKPLHVVIGTLFLVAILLICLLLIARAGC